MKLAPTPRDTVLREGTAQLVRFRRPDQRPAASLTPVLIIPSLINRWYVLDLRPGVSLIASLCRGFDTFCLDWGVPEDEDRYLTWDALIRKVGRAVRAIRRITGADKIALAGYCMGGTMAGIYAALEPEHIAGLVNLAGPFDFAKAGMLATMTDPRWFDAQAVAGAGNVSPLQMQSGFWALQPTMAFAKWGSLLTTVADEDSREAFLALETWANDNTPFPAAAYATYVRELYQENQLIRGQHHALSRRVDLSEIRCPVLTIVASRDTICPPPAATALNDVCGARDRQVLVIEGGHVGVVVGKKAPAMLYPRLGAWLEARFGGDKAKIGMSS